LGNCGRIKGCTYELGFSWFGGLKGTQITQAHIATVDMDIFVKLEKVARSLNMHKPRKTFHGLIVVVNWGRRPTGFAKEKVSRVEELHELKRWI
jgi:hypothetical protein